ncbi:breast carcinoma-amplified sequence 1 isoform X11 [Gadus macrocephalus]|uniref:breast carcinoma-amplified sequence 1 isoform X11 n=1 Tax=Gadus macrocephalus TaxID=80720 RepID=UPI0028CB2155|nr:breast carcinoma-amplified sequence 1 isoform X11 [Gadus macrocephalus]
MGNENSKKKGPIKDGKNGEKHLNGKVNSLKVKNKSDQNGATIEKAEKPNGELTTNTKNKESIVETDGFNVEAPVNGSKDIPGISSEAQVISPKNVPTIQKQQTDEAKGVLKDDEEAPSSSLLLQADTAKNQDSETLEEPKSVPLDLKLAAGQTDNDDQKSQPEEKKEESDQNPVMNFFKTLVTPTKSQKKETATPDVTKDQPPKETPPTVASTTVAQVPEPPAAAKGMSIPPPPPPEPPKMEIKGGLAAQQQKPTPKEGAKASAKQPDAAKGKSAKETLSSFFRSKEIQEVLQQVDQVQDTVPDEPEPVLEVKTVEEVVPEPVVVEVEKADASKTTTLEADVKPQAAAPLPDDKKPAAKSPFFSFFKPKVLVNQMAAKVQSASTSGVRLLRRTAGGAAEPKKETAAPPAAMEAAQNTKAKEEPKAATKTAEASVENKAPSEAAQGGDESAKAPKKLEKRNSINLFFKTLSQKRNSLDAGVQTESAAAAPASEKTK